MELKLMWNYLIHLFDYFKYPVITVLTVLSAFLAPIGDLLVFIAILVVFDLITGIFGSIKKGFPFESSKVTPSLIKFAAYFLIMVVALVFDEGTAKFFHIHIFKLFLPPDKVQVLAEFKFFAAIAFIIVVRETKSIDENWEKMFGWSFFNTAKALFEKVTNIISLLKTLKKS